MPDNPENHIITTRLIHLGAHPKNKEAAIEQAGALLLQSNLISREYIDSMKRREHVANTWLGSGVAIPHGMIEDKHYVLSDSVAILQVPDGVEWEKNEKAHLIFAIAARGNGHLAILRRLTRLLQQPEQLKQLFTTRLAEDFLYTLSDSPVLKPISDPENTTIKHDFDSILEWTLDYPNGLHARPASLWIEAAKPLQITLQIRNGDSISDVRSLVSLLQLNVHCGDRLVLSASGTNARQQLEDFVQFIQSLSDAEKKMAEHAIARQNNFAANEQWRPASETGKISAIAASPGLAIGTIHHLDSQITNVPDIPVSLSEGAVQLSNALMRTKLQIKALIDDITRRIGAADAAIFQAQANLLEDDHLISTTCRYMVQGHGVAWSWWEAIKEISQKFTAMNNPVLAERAADLYDIGRRLLGQFDPAFAGGMITNLPKGPLILISTDLSPSDTAALDNNQICGLATIAGGPTSHTAILARTLGIPALVAGGEILKTLKNGTLAIIDGDQGYLWPAPQEADLISARARIEHLDERRKSQAARRTLPAKTPDGHQTIVCANINRPDQVAFALEQGAEGVGLMRTEFLFMETGHTPDEEEQYAVYRAMLDGLQDRPLIVRALDIGGDKQVEHLNLPKEDNPFLGVRGIRLLLRRPDLLQPQLTALYRAAMGGGNLSLMFPMIMSLDEMKSLKTITEEIRQKLGAPKIPLGIMIEIPSAALMAEHFARYVDFFSIGTNDLTQYTLAIDRQNPELAPQADSLNPAILRIIDLAITGAKRHNCPVGVCGGIAAEPFGAALLVGLGVHELSMTPRDIAAVKEYLRATSFQTMQQQAQRALQLETAAEVRNLALEIS